MAIFDSWTYKIDTPQPITKTVVIGDYVGDLYSYAKFGAHPSTGLLGEWVKYNQMFVYFVIYLCHFW